MDQTISSADANRSFSRILREVREGQSFVVTSHGRPVARIAPCEEGDGAREEAWRKLMEHLDNQTPIENPNPRWSREELYERD